MAWNGAAGRLVHAALLPCLRYASAIGPFAILSAASLFINDYPSRQSSAMDSMIHSGCGDRRPMLHNAKPLQSRADSGRPPRVSAVPLADWLADEKDFAPSADSRLPCANAHAAEFVEFFGPIPIEKVFFQNLQIPQDLLLTLADNVILAVSPTQRIRVDVVQEAIIAGKQMTGKALTAEERRYKQASREIDVPGEIMNG